MMYTEFYNKRESTKPGSLLWILMQVIIVSFREYSILHLDKDMHAV